MYQRLKLLVDRMTTEVTFADTAAAMNDEDAQQWATDLTQLAFEVARFDAEGQSR
jgi:predicted aspartyl protease